LTFSLFSFDESLVTSAFSSSYVGRDVCAAPPELPVADLPALADAAGGLVADGLAPPLPAASFASTANAFASLALILARVVKHVTQISHS